MSAVANPKTSIDILILKNLYYRYQRFVTPLCTVGICFLLFVFLVIPQIQNWFALKDSFTADTQSLQILHQNLSLVTSLDDAKLNQLLGVATSALPANKDFAGMLTSLQNAAAVAGTSLGDYSFTLGDLSGLDEKGKSQLPVQLNITLKGSVTDAQHFAAQLRNQLPLSDTIALVVNQNASITMTIVFYYATLPKITFKDTVQLPVLGKADQQLLTMLSAQSDLGTVELASPSVTPVVTIVPTATPVPVATTSAQ